MKNFTLLLFLITLWLPGQNAGDVDEEFGVFGAQIYGSEPGVDDYGQTIISLENGKFIIAGRSEGFFIIKLQENGNYDTSFGNNGKLHFGGNFFCSGCSGVWDIEELDDGKLLLVGSVLSPSNGVDMAVLRLQEDGTTDLSFGDSGISYLHAGTGMEAEMAYDLQILDNGRILVAGSITENDVTNPLVFQLLPNGDIATDFGTDGYTTASFGAGFDASIRSMAVDQNGRILASCYVYDDNINNFEIGMIRFLENGQLDNTYGTNGLVTSGINMVHGASSSSMILRPDGSTVSVGRRDGSAILVSFDENGVLNSEFGNVGILTFDLGSNTTHGVGIVAHPEGKFLVTGRTYPVTTQNAETFLARFHNDGTFDTTFGDGGWNSVWVSECDCTGVDIAYQYDGKILVGGNCFVIVGDMAFMAGRFYSGLLGTGVQEKNPGILLFPNPSKGVIRIISENEAHRDIQQIVVYDQSGRLIQSFDEFRFDEGNLQLDLQQLSTGTYIVQITLKNSSLTEKLIKL